jgi:hypothetical protein
MQPTAVQIRTDRFNPTNGSVNTLFPPALQVLSSVEKETTMTVLAKTFTLPLATAAALMLLVGNASAKQQGGVKSDFPNPTYNTGPLRLPPPPSHGGFGHHHPSAPTTPTCTNGICQSSQAGGGSRVIQSRPLSNR